MINSPKWKVAIIADPLDFQSAGIYVYLKNLISGINNQNEIEYHLIRANGNLEDFGLPNHILKPKTFPGYLLYRKLFQIPRWLNKQNFDAVVEPAHFGPFNLRKSIKKITVIHDLTPILFPHFHPLHSQILHKIFFKHVVKSTDLIICNSKNTMNDVISFCSDSENKITYIYPSISSIFQPTDYPDIRDIYNLDKPYILTVGTLEPRKDHITLVKAFEKLRQNNITEAKLLVIGRKGWKSQPLFNYILNSPQKNEIIILNDVPENHLPAFYSQCLLFVYPSIYEGFGLPIIEAHRCGAKCIIANNSSLAEIGKDFAIMFETQNEQDLYTTMARELTSTQIENPVSLDIFQSNFSSEFHKAILEVLVNKK